MPIGAILVWEGMLLPKTIIRKEGLLRPDYHAEILVIREAAQKLNNWRLKQAFVTAVTLCYVHGCHYSGLIPVLVFGMNEFKFGGVESTADLRNHPMIPAEMQIYGGIMEKEVRN